MSNHKEIQRLVIIGSGPAGYAAAIYAARAMNKPLVLSGLQPGGQLTITSDVENFPGFVSINGPELMEKMREQAHSCGAEIIDDSVVSVDFNQRPFRLLTASDQEILAETVIVATGASAKWLGIPGEDKYRGFGVSACATCDGFFFKKKHVAVIGGGNTAAEEALYLSNLCSKITLIHRRDKLRCEKILAERLASNPKISFLWNSTCEEFIGDEAGLKSIRTKEINLGKELELDVEGAFVAIGHLPNTSIFDGQLKMDKQGYVVTKDSVKTSVEGVFAAGDVHDIKYRQAVTAAGFGCMAALEANKYLESKI